MKKLFFFTFSIFCIYYSALADCNTFGLNVWPDSGAIASNSIFILTGHFNSEEVIENLNTKYPVYLESDQERISLEVKEVLVGEFYLTQAILHPTSPLKAGHEYHLIVDSIPDYYNRNNETNWNSERGYYPKKWFIKEEADHLEPIFTKKPTLSDNILEYYGCGPEIFAVFSCQIEDQSDCLVKTTVKTIETGKITTYYIPVKEGKIEVGHDMCAGAFNLIEKGKYEVYFSIMDSSGNESKQNTETINFTAPG